MTAIIFVALLARGRTEVHPGVVMVPWGDAFGWSRQSDQLRGGHRHLPVRPDRALRRRARCSVSASAATVITALAMMSLSSAASLFMTESWQLILTWGVVSGIGSGCITNVLSATIVNRWFVTNRGLVMGLSRASPPPAR